MPEPFDVWLAFDVGSDGAAGEACRLYRAAPAAVGSRISYTPVV